jgi:hypothetical protein
MQANRVSPDQRLRALERWPKLSVRRVPKPTSRLRAADAAVIFHRFSPLTVPRGLSWRQLRNVCVQEKPLMRGTMLLATASHARGGTSGISCVCRSRGLCRCPVLVLSALPFPPDVERRNAAKHANLAAWRSIDDEHAIVRNQLSGTTVEKQQELYLCLRSLGKILHVTYIPPAIQSPENRPCFAGCKYVGLNRHDRVLSQNSFLSGVGFSKKLLKPFAGQCYFGIIGRRRNQRVVT